MQALFLFVIFGLFYAVVMAVMASGSASSIQLKQAQIEGVKIFFQSVEYIVNQRIVPVNMYVANQGTTVKPYLNRAEIKSGLNWNYAPTTMQDPWGRDFTGFVTHQRLPVRAQSGGGQVQIPITGFVLISSGPDRRLDPALQAKLSKLSATSDIRSVMNIEATSNTDDIVHTFSAATAAISRWQNVEDKITEMAEIVARQYNADYFVFSQKIQEKYGANSYVFYDNKGRLIVSNANRTTWAADGITENPADMVIYRNQDKIGAEGARRYIQQESNLLIKTEAYKSTNGIASPTCNSVTPVSKSDTLRICITNNGSPWGNSSGQLFYYKDIKGEQG